MNERIKELMAQAVRFRLDPDSNAYEAQVSPEDLELFAELLIRECVEQCNINFVGTVGTHPNAHNRGVKKCIDNIKQHFGVSE